MTPLTQNPKLVLLVDGNGNVLKSATNVAADLEIKVVRDETTFNDEAANKPFVN